MRRVSRAAPVLAPLLASSLALACAGRREATPGPVPAAPSRSATAAAQGVGPHGGRFVAPAGGTALMFCGSPGLSANIKLDSAGAGVTTFAMGTAAVAAGGANSGAHSADDEAVYFLHGEGRAFIGADTTTVRPGLVMYVPRGVQHGFISTGGTPLEFLWVIAPGQLAAGFRARGVPPGSPCPLRVPG